VDAQLDSLAHRRSESAHSHTAGESSELRGRGDEVEGVSGREGQAGVIGGAAPLLEADISIGGSRGGRGRRRLLDEVVHHHHHHHHDVEHAMKGRQYGTPPVHPVIPNSGGGA
jgi:hypothetical protein